MGRRRHTFESIDGGRGRVRDVVRYVQPTIQREMGVAVVKIGFTTGGHSDTLR